MKADVFLKDDTLWLTQKNSVIAYSGDNKLLFAFAHAVEFGILIAMSVKGAYEEANDLMLDEIPNPDEPEP